ncbi:MAG: transcriptional regulator [Epsilonproteobacteria bacterium]|nr:transcriptional regulator [Campylobacterota bacterium]
MFDPLLHQPIRSKLISLLISNEELPFVVLKSSLEVTDGNLSSHLNKLESAGYIEIEKMFEGKRPKTVIRMHEKGKKAFYDYIKALKSFVEEN